MATKKSPISRKKAGEAGVNTLIAATALGSGIPGHIVAGAVKPAFERATQSPSPKKDEKK
ncbi:MAG: hypothetical protein ACXWH7_09165 [Thermoanaerobaculia bacterium]